MRKTVTIPAAGESQSVDITGRSLIIESCGVYQTVQDVPTFNFVPGGNQNPIYPRSTFFNVDAEDNIFNQIEIIGTAASAGDEVTFYSTMACLSPELNINVGESYQAIAGDTKQNVLSDSVFSFVDFSIVDENGNLPKSVLVSSTNNSIHLAFNVDPTQGAGGLGHRITDGNNAGQHWVEIEGIDFILSARFINRTNGTNAVLNYTFRY